MMRGAPGEAEGLLRRALAARRKALGAGHPEVAETTAALGTALAALGLTAEAALCYRRALVILEETLGDEHPRTRVAATSLIELDAWQDALALERDLTTAPLDDGAFLRRLRAFSGYIALRSQEHQGLLMASRGDIERGVLLFTAPDLAEAFLASAGEALQQEMTCEVLRGEDLPLLLRAQEADGVILQGAAEARGIPGKAWG
jgi:tetratricopeptide (TPR) repeat protein